MGNKLEKTIGPLIGVGSGLVVGAIDTFTSGSPLVTTYFLGRSVEQASNISFCNKKQILFNFGSYLIGNTIPFYFKYAEEVNSFVEGVLKWWKKKNFGIAG